MKCISRIVVAALMFSGVASAQSAKVEMRMNGFKALGTASTQVSPAAFTGQFKTIMSGTIKMAQQKDLSIGVSLVTALMTDTTVASSKYRTDTASADAGVEVQVLVDGNRVAEPGTITFDRRKQTMMAQFDGFSCQIAADGTLSGCAYQDEILQLSLETEAAHAFFFGLTDVGVGVHKIEVQARTAATALSGSATASDAAFASKASAFINKGSFTVEEVQLIKGTDITALP